MSANYLGDPDIDPVVGDPDDLTTIWRDPAAMRGQIPLSELCAGAVASDYLCTRHPGHKGAHACGNGVHIMQVWSQ